MSTTDFETVKLVISYGTVESGKLRFQCDELGLDFLHDDLHNVVPMLVKEYRKKLEAEGKKRFAISPEVHLITGDMVACACDLKG